MATTSPSAYPLFPINMVGTAVTSRDDRGPLPPWQKPNAWKRQSLPISDAYAGMVGPGGDIHAALAKRQPGDRSSMHSTYNDNTLNYNNHIIRRRSLYYDEQFQYREPPPPQAMERLQDSPIIAELKTNVIIKDEFTLVNDLSHQLAARYTRPGSVIMVKVDHSACLALGGKFDPCYVLTLTAVPSQMSPGTNKRNAGLIQSFMADILSVPADRGIIRFETIEECNIATNGSTMAGEFDRLEKQSQDGTQTAMKRAITSASRKSVPVPRKTINGMDLNDSMNGNGMTPLAQKRKSMGATTQSSTVFELFADPERPSTAHGHAYDGLRMNGVSKEDLVGRASRLSNGRPKSMVAPPDLPRTASVPKSVQRHTSNRASQQYGMPPHRPANTNRVALSASLKPEQKSLSHVATLSKSDGRRPRDSHMDDSSVSRDSSVRRHVDQSSDPKIDARAVERVPPSNGDASSIISGKDATANSARRRSTITATPKMPAPPPIPETKTKEPKVGKRKSFLAAFRRSTAAA